MIIDKMPAGIINDYKGRLCAAGMLSKMFSDNDSPYINPRTPEKTFCACTGAKDVSRSDLAVDAVFLKDDAKLPDTIKASVGKNTGVGIKTFLNGNGSTFQKISEFDKDSSLFRNELPENRVRIIAELHNARLASAKRIYSLDGMWYHCIVREPGFIKIYEEPMEEINIAGIKKVELKKDSTIRFEDGRNEYSFNLNKSTLYKRFITQNVLLTVPVQIIEDPYSKLASLFAGSITAPGTACAFSEPPVPDYPRIILPLFSNRSGKNVPEKSGLNHWNAQGRPRDPDEAYIPVPAWIHKKFPDFFPGRDQDFSLHLPNETVMSAKICQQGGKALMSNPNSSLGRWLLRDILLLPEYTLATYDLLQKINIDSVEIIKKADLEYSIDFLPRGSFDEFEEENR